MNRVTKKQIILSLALLLLVNKAYAMRYDLPRMVQMSGLIAVVAPAHPAMYEKRFFFDEEWKELPDDLKSLPLSNPDIPPFVQLVSCFVIKDVLHGDRKVGDHIEVVLANHAANLSAHFNYYALGMNMSNDYDIYRPKYEVSDDSGERIVFLRPYTDQDDEEGLAQDSWDPNVNRRPPKFYQFVADPGYEGLEARPEIERLIKMPRTPEVFDDPFKP